MKGAIVTTPVKLRDNHLYNRFRPQFNSTRAKYDRYWQLLPYGRKMTVPAMRHLLSEAGYLGFNRATSAVLTSAVQRLDRGLPCYDACSDEELRRFVRDRGLGLCRGDRKGMVAGLRDADELLRFERFLELPPELRVRVYDFYVAGFVDRRLRTPAQPPLAQTCRLMRSEVLPVFYSACTFVLEFVCRKARSDLTAVRVKPVPDTAAFLASLNPASVAAVRHVRIEVEDSELPAKFALMRV